MRYVYIKYIYVMYHIFWLCNNVNIIKKYTYYYMCQAPEQKPIGKQTGQSLNLVKQSRTNMNQTHLDFRQ